MEGKEENKSLEEMEEGRITKRSKEGKRKGRK
jgi:hypothetical protein